MLVVWMGDSASKSNVTAVRHSARCAPVGGHHQMLRPYRFEFREIETTRDG